ncbi:hypothetical protein [Microbacterium terricola]|uniref:Uncharacterized protein n=1 Tax=Microbacterium terricola TaxID=344163 RepID=A0ABM8DUU7_9MICO|nr:hypothetical protein [Microbacterium terricola]UYK39872.1 hypothetical protein OAU46_14425 [Microbacterium terricola]BDV29372.1 hypothetical protein Microterr_00320 [Microbacterium terricola]
MEIDDLDRRRRFKRARAATAVLTVASLSVFLSSCALDALIWGFDGAEVIKTTSQFARAAAAGDASAFICAGQDPPLGEPRDWEGVTPEEPEQFVSEYWPDQVPRDPDWSINVYVPVERQTEGAVTPGDVFYQETDNGLCVVDVVWVTVIEGQ